ncbi:hypothetical protein ACFFRR_004204 [Megaselia abdita]
MIAGHHSLLIVLCSSVLAVPIEITFPEKIDQIVFPRLINSITFEENEQICDTGEVCKNFSECETALSDWKKTKQIPKTCYFKGKDHFVCCRENGVPKPSGIKSKKMCDDLYPKPQTQRLALPPDVHAAVGGENAALNEFPYMAALGWNNGKNINDYLCGGVLIDFNYVLTAAHCISMKGDLPKFVKIGGRDLLSNKTDFLEIDLTVEKVIVHPEYDPNLSYHDIALVKLQSSSFFPPACLWTLPTPPASKLVALGYGHKEFAGMNSNILQKVNITLFENEECALFYNGQPKIPNGIIEKQLCAGDYSATRDTCQGDSGGPLLAMTQNGFLKVPQIIGITSFGSACASGVPGVYTRVSEYIDWIESIMEL